MVSEFPISICFTRRIIIQITLLVLEIGLMCPTLHATTIIALILPDEIIIGADSKVTVIGPNERRSTTECKIRRVRNNIYFVYGGLMGDILGTFDIPRLVSEAFSRGQTLTGSIEHVESLVAESLSSFLDIENSRHRGFYETMSKGRATEIYIFGFEGEVFFKLRRFVPSFLGGKTRVNIERMDCPGKCPTIVALLASNAPYKFVQANPSYWKEHGDVAFLRHLMALDIAAAPDKSGFPIDILRFSGREAEWIQKQPNCE